MEKDVMIFVRGMQFLEDSSQDELETVCQGEYYFRNGSHFLLYDEYMEGYRQPVRNCLQIKENALTVIKKGLIDAQMYFVEGKKYLTSYQTPFGAVWIGLDTQKICLTDTAERLCLEVEYMLEANHQFVSDCRIRIEARPKDGERIRL